MIGYCCNALHSYNGTSLLASAIAPFYDGWHCSLAWTVRWSAVWTVNGSYPASKTWNGNSIFSLRNFQVVGVRVGVSVGFKVNSNKSTILVETWIKVCVRTYGLFCPPMGWLVALIDWFDRPTHWSIDPSFIHRLIDSSFIHRLIDSSIDWFIVHPSIDWFILHSSVDWFIVHSSVDWFTDRFLRALLAGWLNDWLIDWLIGQSIYW